MAKKKLKINKTPPTGELYLGYYSCTFIVQGTHPLKNNNWVYNYNITKYRKNKGAQGIIKNKSPYKDL